MLHLPVALLPEEEREIGYLIGQNLEDLPRLYDEVRAALVLFNRSHDEQSAYFAKPEMTPAEREFSDILFTWMRIALRHGAISTYEFSEMIQSLDGNVAKCPTIKDARNDDKMGEARDVFKAAFPNIELLRHGAAHASEFGSTQKRLNKHSSSEEFVHPLVYFKGRYASNNVADRTYFATVKGKTVQYTLDRDHLDALLRVMGLIWEAFRPVAEALEGRNRQRGG